MTIDEAFKQVQDVVLADQVRTINKEGRTRHEAERVMQTHHALWTIKQQLKLSGSERHGT